MPKKKKSKKKQKDSNIVDEYEVFGEFAFIAGYTEGGMPCGIIHEQMEEEFPEDWPSNDPAVDINDENLPF